MFAVFSRTGAPHERHRDDLVRGMSEDCVAEREGRVEVGFKGLKSRDAMDN